MPNIQCNSTYDGCPDNCDELVLPSVVFDDCNPEINSSEIEWIAVARASAPDFDDVEDAAEWTTRIVQTAPEPVPGTPDDTIRMIRVIGDKPAPEVQTRTLSGGRTSQVGKTHTLNIEIDETNAVNYEFARTTACNGTYKLWYITRAGLVYGGICGVPAQIQLNLVQGRGEDAIELYQGTVTWKDRIDPPRANFPLAGTVDFSSLT